MRMGGRALGNYQKKSCTKKGDEKMWSKSKKIGARPDPEKNSCPEKWPSLPLPHIKNI